MTARRTLIVLIVPALIIAALAYPDRPERGSELSGSPLGRVMPVASPAEATSSLWYCPAGTATGDGGLAEQTLHLTNTADEATGSVVTLFPDVGDPVYTEVELGAGERQSLDVASLLRAEHVAAVVEAERGGVVVEHELVGTTGSTAGPCSSTVSPTWYLPGGTTSLGVMHLLAVFNPFPTAAVVDITVETDIDTRTPPEFQGFVVEPRSVRVVDVADVVTVRDHLSTTVVARSGLVAVERIEVVTDEADLVTSLDTLLGSPVAEQTWYFPSGPPVGPDTTVQFMVFNPSASDDAEVDVQVLVDDPEAVGFVEPFELSVRPGQFSIVDVSADGRMPEGAGWSAYVQSRNDVGVIPTLMSAAVDPASPQGRAVSLGSPLEAAVWILPSAPGGSDDAASIAVTNPSTTTEAEVDVIGLDGEVLTTVVVAPGTREVVVATADELPADADAIEQGEGEDAGDPGSDDASDPAPGGDVDQDDSGEGEDAIDEAVGDEEVPGADQPAPSPADDGELAEPQRVDTGDAVRSEDDARPVIVRSASPIVVQVERSFADGRGLARSVGVPLDGTLERPLPAVTEAGPAPTIVLDGFEDLDDVPADPSEGTADEPDPDLTEPDATESTQEDGGADAPGDTEPTVSETTEPVPTPDSDADEAGP